MANLNGSLENKTIRLTKEDTLLNRWRLNVSKDSTGNISSLIKIALRYYIRTQTFCCIGKVCLRAFDPDADQLHTICIYLSDSPDIVSWFQLVKQAGVAPATMIKSILNHSIIEVDSPGEEWLPSSLELFQLEFRLEFQLGEQTSRQVKPVLANLQSVSVTPDVIRDKPTTVHADRKNAQETSGFKRQERVESTGDSDSVPERKPEKQSGGKKRPRAYALRGVKYKN